VECPAAPAPRLLDREQVSEGADQTLARHDPAGVLARAERPFLSPKLDWEINGNVPNVIFLEGAVAQSSPAPNRSLDFIGYYGGADKFIGAGAETFYLRLRP